MTGTLCPDFMGLFHQMERCIKISKEEVDPVTKKRATLLLQILKHIGVLCGTSCKNAEPLADIGIYPLSHDPEPEKLREGLVQRGRRFDSLRGYFFMTSEDFNVTRPGFRGQFPGRYTGAVTLTIAYTVSASDLGTNAARVEAALKKALDMCALWRAVMLIDEADVFPRSPQDRQPRTQRTCFGYVRMIRGPDVFLRLLEYYQGILFLTTNRVATIDTAFESRIDLIIPYDDFDQAARRQVWVNFANSLVGGAHELCGADFKELSEQKLNGREIKSTVKTGLMLAQSEGKTLGMEHLRIVLEFDSARQSTYTAKRLKVAGLAYWTHKAIAFRAALPYDKAYL
ncbi:hypothetical protein EKO27_g5647 [Xylaria grammica]|uniref:ATPase AAA-type core domain-containing protein n=1 Tax=Xylaria grammica TaxID=363999 RepID=A0A439D4Z7_9PEZI|nr:hypothetical protein EKO27_g5647 [Xylaria grammica]